MKITKRKSRNICKTCGTRYHPDNFDVTKCPICLDERQFVKDGEQYWVSYDEIQQNYLIHINQLRSDVFELKMLPDFAIGQKAHLLITSNGNVLWDCLPFFDKPTADFISAKGGLKLIAISHPHFYGIMDEWAHYFNCPIYLNSKDENWIMDNQRNIQLWNSDMIEIFPHIHIVNVEGHFPGSSVLFYDQANKPGTIFTGDSIYLSRDKKHLSSMYSYPNLIPLKPAILFEVFARIRKLDFDSLYGAFSWQNLEKGAKSIFRHSYEKHQRIYNN